MTATVQIRDEATGAPDAHEFALEVLTEKITVRELIRSRVYQEVKDHNLRSSDVYQSLVQPLEAENAPGGAHARKKQKRPIDWQKQFDTALEAFQRRQVLVLVDDRQVEDLEEEVQIAANTVVTFVRLVPLVGG